jgi:hypothetical protein
MPIPTPQALPNPPQNRPIPIPKTKKFSPLTTQKTRFPDPFIRYFRTPDMFYTWTKPSGRPTGTQASHTEPGRPSSDARNGRPINRGLESADNSPINKRNPINKGYIETGEP